MRRTLVLDDNADSLCALRTILEWHGHSIVLEACDPQDAIRICTDGPAVDLLVCDILLKCSMSGIDAATHILRSCPDMPVLFISGTPLVSLENAAFEALRQLLPTRVDFIEKPFTAAQLLAATDRLLSAVASPPEFLRAFDMAAVFRNAA